MFGMEHIGWDMGRWNAAVYLVACVFTYVVGSPELMLVG